MELVDSYGRKINYLRLSVTDRCNLRCSYCMPADGVEKLRHVDILSYEELLLASRAAVALGVEKIRVTGGEPLVRRDLVPFLQQLSELPGLAQLVLTTNGVLLPEMSPALRRAGVQRLNISLDSLVPETFRRISRTGDLRRVLAGIEVAEAEGFPIKINMVAMRGVNSGEILDFAALTLERPWTVRFIEYMPTLPGERWRELLMPGQEILDTILSRYPLQPVDRGSLAGPSRDFAIRGARGSLGIITPVSGHFCDSCNRLRITSSGSVKSCLFSSRESDLRPALATGSVAAVQEFLASVVEEKPGRHRLAEERREVAMSAVGG